MAFLWFRSFGHFSNLLDRSIWPQLTSTYACGSFLLCFLFFFFHSFLFTYYYLNFSFLDSEFDFILMTSFVLLFLLFCVMIFQLMNNGIKQFDFYLNKNWVKEIILMLRVLKEEDSCKTKVCESWNHPIKISMSFDRKKGDFICCQYVIFYPDLTRT